MPCTAGSSILSDLAGPGELTEIATESATDHIWIELTHFMRSKHYPELARLSE